MHGARRTLAGVMLCAACSSGSGEVAQGNENGACYPNGSCNVGLGCVLGVCRRVAADSGATQDHRVSEDRGNAPGCACDRPGDKRCAGNAVQLCSSERQWVEPQRCEGGQVCAFASCVAAGSGCPDAGEYDGNQWIVSRTAPQPVSACLAGDGTAVTYKEDSHESHARAVSFNLDPSCSSNPFALGLNLTEIFGMNPDSPVASESLIGGVGATVPQGKKYQFYRQTITVHRLAKLTAGGKFVGTAALTDFSYTPEIAVGDTCPVASKMSGAIADGVVCATHADACSCP